MKTIPGICLWICILVTACSSVPPRDAIRVACTWEDYAFDTRSGTLELSLSKDSTMTIPLQFTPAEESKILAVAKQIGFFELAHDAPFAKLDVEFFDPTNSMQGCRDYAIRIETPDQANWVKWDSCDRRRVNRERSVWRLLDVIIATVRQKPEFGTLPVRMYM